HLDLCARYQLPDRFVYGSVKLFTPTYNQNIEKVEMVIFNSLGEEVFFTTNPEIRWDARNANTGNQCAPGSYFYNCEVYERTSQGVIKRNMTGIIELVY